MHVYSGWPQLLSTRSSTSWYVPTESPLGRREKKNLRTCGLSKAQRPQRPHFLLWGQVLQGQSIYLQVKCLDGVAIVVIGEMSKEKALLLSFFF